MRELFKMVMVLLLGAALGILAYGRLPAASGDENSTDAEAQKEVALGFWSALVTEGDAAKAKTFAGAFEAKDTDAIFDRYSEERPGVTFAAQEPVAVIDIQASLAGGEPGPWFTTYLMRDSGAWKVDATRTFAQREFRPNRGRNESAAISSLRTLVTVQSLYRDTDKDGNQEVDFAPSLAKLYEHDLIDEVLASGMKQGYTFELVGSFFEFSVVATPVSAETGTRSFFVDQSGVIRFEKADSGKRPSVESTPIGG